MTTIPARMRELPCGHSIPECMDYRFCPICGGRIADMERDGNPEDTARGDGEEGQGAE